MNTLDLKIIAEIANSHQGSVERALETALKFYEYGADIVKFQVYTANDLVASNHERWSHFDKQSFSLSEWTLIFQEMETKGIPYAVDIFGLESLKIVKSFKPKFIKIHLSDIDNIPLHKGILSFGCPVALGAGGADFKDLSDTIKSLRSFGANQIILFHGFQAYPTLPEETNLDRIRLFGELFGKSIHLGISDHIDGSDELSSLAPIMSLSYGVRYIEKHVTLNRDERGVDYYSSMTPKIFRKFVQILGRAKTLIGDPGSFSTNEIKYFSNVKKVWVAKKEIVEGQIITEEDIINVRINETLYSYVRFNDILGKKVLTNIPQGCPIQIHFLIDS